MDSSKTRSKYFNKLQFLFDKFKKNIHLHDKIEFGIIYTCYTANTNNKIKSDLKKKFSELKKKISNSLKQILLLLKISKMILKKLK